MKRSIRLAMAALCVLGATVVHAEMITALAIKDTYVYDRDTNRTRTHGWNEEGRLARARVGQWHPDGGEIIQFFVFEQDKLQGFSSSEVVSAKLRWELRMIYGGGGAEGEEFGDDAGLLENQPHDIIAIKEPWDEHRATWNAQEQSCSLIFGIIWNCTEDEDVDWIPDNGVDDDVTAVLGNDIYGGLDSITPSYGYKVSGIGEIKEFEATDMVKAWADGTEDPAAGLAIRNRIDVNCKHCPHWPDEDNSRNPWYVSYWYPIDATTDPFSGNERPPMDGLVVHNDDPWPPIVPQLVIELGEAGPSHLAGDANQDGVVSADDYASRPVQLWQYQRTRSGW